jgi:hypothetical protein
MARSNFSGAMLGRPPLMSASYIPAEQGFDLLQGLVDHLAHRTQADVCWHEVVQATHREQALGEGVGSAHGDCLAYVSGEKKGCLR